MALYFKPRAARWAGQPSTFFLLLNACLLTFLIRCWSAWGYPVPQVSAWVHAPHEHSDEGHNMADLFPALHQSPPTPRLPAFCDACGPEDTFCREYGSSLLARSRAYEGANARLHRVLRDAVAGKPIKIAVLGGSVTRGQGVARHEVWTQIFHQWWNATFPGQIILQNGAVAATGSSYMSMCFKEHIDEDADIVITELAINDQRYDQNAESFEWLTRQLLELPKQPAVIQLQTFGFGYAQLTTGGDLHTSVGQYYDTPIISLRNALLPQLLKTPEVVASYFIAPGGKPDLKHIGSRGHAMLADLLSAFVERQLCTALSPSREVSGSGAAATMLSEVGTVDLPSHRMFQNVNEAPAPSLDPFCASTRAKRNPLAPAYNDGRWENWSYTAPNAVAAKTYLRATEPGAKVGFSVPVRGGLGRVRVQYLSSATFELGIAKCWLDDDSHAAVAIDGHWKSPLNLASTSVISKNATIGDHMLWCELTAHTNSPGKGTEFRIIGVDAA